MDANDITDEMAYEKAIIRLQHADSLLRLAQVELAQVPVLVGYGELVCVQQHCRDSRRAVDGLLTTACEALDKENT